jgi:serum/glucocorticoid-regulated kinase 2
MTVSSIFDLFSLGYLLVADFGLAKFV